jgi:uncharacterized membrane protein YkvI
MAATNGSEAKAMYWLRIVEAVVILAVWALVVNSARRNPELTTLATVITPVMLIPAGALFRSGTRRKDDAE